MWRKNYTLLDVLLIVFFNYDAGFLDFSFLGVDAQYGRSDCEVQSPGLGGKSCENPF